MPPATNLEQLIRLLEPAAYPRQQCIDALHQNAQNVARAAEWLLLADVADAASQSRKRKAKTTGTSGLASWLKVPRTAGDSEQGTTTNGNTECIALDTSDSDEGDLEILEATALNSDGLKCKDIHPPTGVKFENAILKKRKPMDPAGFMAHLTANQEKTLGTPTRRPGERPLILRSNLGREETSITYANMPTLTLHRSPLSSALASALYLQLMQETDSFERHEWYLAGRWVKSPHTSKYYHSGQLERDDEVASTVSTSAGNQYWYAGKQVQPAPVFPSLLQEASEALTPFVNNILATRSRFAGEFAGEWKASYAAVNHYQGAASSVGWHADQLTYLGPYATIVSLSLGTPREFRLRPAANPEDASLDVLGSPLRTYAVTLGHNSICIMHAGTQELYKHTVPHTSGSLDIFKPPYDLEQQWVEPGDRKGYNSRINITFRFYRPDFRPYPEVKQGGLKREGTPICRCGIPSILRADQKGKARAARGTDTAALSETAKHGEKGVTQALAGMVYFWQCQSSSVTGSDKGCGFFRILDFKAEGRGPCIGYD